MLPQRCSLMFATLLMLTGLLFTGCLKDECQNKFTIYRPVFKSLSAARNEMKWEASRNVENPGKIYLYGKYLLLNDIGRGIHVWDNSQPTAPKKLGFLRIWGNVDMAIRNNMLYADSYSDLAVFPIQDWSTAQPVLFRNKVFSDRFNFWGNLNNPDSVRVIVDYEKVDTVVDCETVSRWNNCPNCMFEDASGRSFAVNAAAASNPNGTGGSMARFTLVNEYLYTVTNTSLNTFDVSNAQNPVLVSNRSLGWNIETIYPFGNKLFIGSMTGMFIFDLANPAAPVPQGSFSHARRCDPVVADGNFAYVTLRGGGQNDMCGGNSNQLDVVNITNVNAPYLVKTYPLSGPYGLSKDGDRLFVCDGKEGLKVYDGTSPDNLKLLQTIGGMGETYDVIAQNNVALVVAREGVFQYDYSNRNAMKLISKISTSN